MMESSPPENGRATYDATLCVTFCTTPVEKNLMVLPHGLTIQ